MRISEVSKSLNIPSATLRYYEQIGLLEKVEKKNGIREYNEHDIERLNFIACMKKSGFKLEDIAAFINTDLNTPSGAKTRLEMLLKQKELLLQEIKEKEETLKFLDYKINLYKNRIIKKDK